MTLSTFCELQLMDIRTQLDAFEQALLRRRWVREWEIEKARLWAEVEARMNAHPGIARDIREWITEPPTERKTA